MFSLKIPDNSISPIKSPLPTKFDFSQGRVTESGQLCVTQVTSQVHAIFIRFYFNYYQEDIVKTVETDPVLECTHKQQVD